MNEQIFYKELPDHERIFFAIMILSDAYSYFGNIIPEPDELKRQSKQLDDDLKSISKLTKQIINDAIKHGRTNSDNILKASPRLIVQWVRDFKLRFEKSSQQTIHNSFDIQQRIQITTDQRYCWIISGYRQYHENKCDMEKFFDFGSIKYESIYKHCGFQLSPEQIEWCIEQGKKMDAKMMFVMESFLSRSKRQKESEPYDTIKGNPNASAFACKLFYDQFKDESTLRESLMWFKPVENDHWIASWQYTPSRVNYHNVIFENQQKQTQSFLKL